MGQNAYKNGDSEALQAIDYNSDLATGRLKRAFADNEKMPDIVANAYNEGRDMEQFVAQRASSLTPAQKEAISKYVEAMDAKKGAIDALQHADDGYGEALKQQLWPYQTEDGNIVPATLDSGKQVFLKKANEYGGAFVVVPDEQGQPMIKQVSNAEIKEVGTPVSLDEYIENAVAQQKDARAQQFISQFDGSGLKPNDQVTVAMEEGDANINMTFAGYSKDGKIVLTDGKDYLPLSKEEFAAWRKNALDNTINEHLDAEDVEREQAQIKKAEADKQERYKKGIFGYAAGKPDYSDTQTDPKVAAEYLQETAGEDRKALFANIVAEKQALQKRISQLREHIANNEEWLSLNADLDPENAETRSLANKQMQGQIVDLQARFDQWNKIRSAVMTPEEAEAIKADRTEKIAEAGVNDGDVAPIEGREVAVLSDEELKKQYPTMDEATSYITSERKKIYRIQSDEVQREINGVDEVLDRYVNGEIDLEPEQLKELNTTKAQLQARQANLTESAKDLKAQTDKLKTLYRKENMEARAKAMENMTPAEQRAVKVENAIKNGNLSQLNSIYEEVRGATDFTDTEPNTIEEYVANNIGRFSLNYEGKDKAGVLSNGIKQETGLGRKDFDKLQILAKEGEGKTVPEFVHSLYDNMPEQLKQMGYSDQDIRDAFLNLISSAENYLDLKNYTLNNKVSEAEQQLRTLEHQEEEMMEEATSYEINDETAPFADRLETAISETETEPTEAQKKAGNYKKGHLSFGGYDYTVETPKGVTRSGKDEQGKPWSVTMHDTYGYILGKIGVDGDHIDMFINDAADLDTFDGNVYVVDQVNPETGEFDEHKVMYGYPDEAAATKAYLSNYSKGWKGLGKVTAVPKATFDKWLESSDRKTKPFRDYAMIQHEQAKKANETLPFDAPMSMDDLPFHRDVKEVKPENLTEAQKVAYDAVSTMLKKAGIPVKVVSNEDMEKVAEAQDNLAVEMLLNDPRLRFYIKTPEQKEAAKAAYDWAEGNRPDKFKQYAIVNMDNPNQPPQYFEKKDLAEKWRKYYTNAWKIGNYKAFNLNKPFEEQIKDVKGDVPSEFDPYKAESLLNKRIELEKQIKETEDSYNAKKKERAEYQNQLMQDYMDQHGLSSENDIPDDVWTDYRDKSFEKYQDTLDDLFHKYVELDNQLKAVAEPGVRFLRTYHGSGANFSEFDFDHMSEGAGSQVFGWGGYVTSSKKIGKDYASIKYDPDKDVEYVGKNKKTFTDLIATLFDGGIRDYNYVKNTLLEISDNDKSNISKKEEYDWFVSTKPEDWFNPNPTTNRNLYEVNIPEDNGSNYLEWEKTLTEKQINAIRDALAKNGVDISSFEKRGFKLDLPFKYVYTTVLPMMMHSKPKDVSKFLSSLGFTGIKYPAGTIMGGAEEGDTNYVIFKPEDMKIVDHTKFAQGKGVVYGYTDGKEIVLNQEHLNPNTPIHEYQHLWRTAAKNMNPELIEYGDKLIMQTQLFADLKQDPNYNHLTDEQICDEAFARLTGEDGAAILEQMAKDAIKENPLDTAKELSVINKLKEWLKKFWYWALDTFTKWKPEDIKKMTLEDIRNLVLRDLANGVDPRTVMNEKKEGVKLSNKEKDDATERIDKRIAELNRQEKEQSLKSENGNLAESHDNGYLPSKDNLDGVQSVAPSSAKIDKKFPTKTFYLGNLANFITSMGKNADITAGNFTKKLFEGMGMTPHGKDTQVSEYFKYQTDDGGKTTVRLSDHSGNALSIIKKGGRADKGYSIVVRVDSSPKTKFKANKYSNVAEYVYENPNADGLKDIARSVFNLIDTGEYLDLAGANEVHVSPRNNDADKTLAGVHNITEEKLRKALKLGGLANPSLAVIDTSKSAHDNFGEISFIAPSALVDKRTGKTGGTWITDAYTQRYPSVERQMSEKGSQKFEDWVDSLEYPSAAKAEIKRQTKDVLEDNGVPAWELMYLKEKGIDIKAYDSNVDYRWKEIINKYPTVDDILNSMQNDPELNEDVMSLAKYQIVKPTRDKISLEVRRQIYKETGVKTAPISPKVRKKVNEIFDRDYKSTLLDKDGKPKAEDVKKVVEQMVKEHNDTKKYDFYLSKVKASNYVHKNGLYADYIRWQENKLDEFGTKNRIFRGYKKDGSRKYVPETLENVSKAMREEANGQTNGGEYTSFGSFIAKLASRVDSTSEMRANKEKLSSNKDKEEFYEKWQDVYYDLAKTLYNDVFYGEQRLHDIVLQPDPKKYAKKEYGITLTPSFMKKLDSLKNAVQNELKSAYFETKFNRPVHLNEFVAAVVPNDLGEDVRKGLEESGLSLFDYDPEKEGDRSRAFNEAINSNHEIRFHRVTEVKSPIMEQKLQKHPDSLMKAGTYFSGGGLVEEGLKGIIDPVVAVEYDRKISGVYRNNFGQHIVTADVRDVDPKELVKHIDGEVEYFHASPVCKNYSQAKSNSGEVELDKETAKSTADFINAVKPRVVTIENVKGYKDSEAMKIITQALDKNGYKWDADVYNAADFGGYTSRERLIVRAVKDGELPEKPKKQPRKGGWLEAVEDILPTLTVKESGVAPWMDARLKADGIDWQKVEKPLYVMGSAYADGKIPHAYGDEILPTLRTKSGDVIIMPGGKVLRADGRVLARITGLGDDYKLPKTESLAHTIIGNGIPVQLTQGVIAPLLNKDDLSGRNVLARLGSSIFKNNWDADKQKQVSDLVVNTANKLGGAEATVYTSVDEVPDAYLSDVKNGATGWYDPTTHTVHVYLPNCADANEAERTVLHEKIGHEGMEVLLGGENEVRKFANFVYRSASKDVRGKIIDFANKYDPDWKNNDRMNVGTQEYIAHLAEEGPKTAEDFSLWTKIKHYLIKVLKKLGVRVPGLLNDKDLRYYLMKAGKALHVWDEMPQEKQEAMMKQASNAEIKDALSDGAGKGKPRQKKGESTIQYMKRVQEWRKWQNAREDKENPEPPMFYDIDKDEAGKKEWAQLNKDWRERHHLVGEEPTGMPIRMEGEENDAYMNRIQEYEKWKDAMKDQKDPLPDCLPSKRRSRRR